MVCAKCSFFLAPMDWRPRGVQDGVQEVASLILCRCSVTMAENPQTQCFAHLPILCTAVLCALCVCGSPPVFGEHAIARERGCGWGVNLSRIHPDSGPIQPKSQKSDTDQVPCIAVRHSARLGRWVGGAVKRNQQISRESYNNCKTKDSTHGRNPQPLVVRHTLHNQSVATPGHGGAGP